MVRSKQPPRLSRHEIRELGRVASSLMSVYEALGATNWAGAVTSRAIVAQAVDLMLPIYRRARAYLPEVQRELEAAARESAEQSEAAAEIDGENGTAASAAEED